MHFHFLKNLLRLFRRKISVLNFSNTVSREIHVNVGRDALSSQATLRAGESATVENENSASRIRHSQKRWHVAPDPRNAGHLGQAGAIGFDRQGIRHLRRA